jgi:coenzyme Q-binding protein COQ10
MTVHSEQRVIPFRPELIFDLVADVRRYPEFLPWCVGARIRQTSAELVVADVMIGYKLVREQFTSKVALDRVGCRIDVEYADGPFKYLSNYWIFKQHPDGCLVDFHVDFEFRSALLQGIIAALFNEAIKRMVSAFESRAHALYGADGGTMAELPAL